MKHMPWSTHQIRLFKLKQNSASLLTLLRITLRRLQRPLSISLAICIFSNLPAQAENLKSPIKEHMLQKIVPASDRLFAVANQPPENAAAWAKVKGSVLSLSASAKWLTKHTSKDNPQLWRQFAQDLQHAASNALHAVNSKNPDAVAEAGDSVYAVCQNCHTAFLPKTTTGH
jgi:cytochrome c556